MNDERFEYLVSQYLDGTLSDEERTAVEERLRDDPEARAMLVEYGKLAGVIRSGVEPVAELKWDRVAERISGAIDEGIPNRNYSIRLYRGVAGLAMAASVLVAIGMINVWMSKHSGGPKTATVASTLEVAGPTKPLPEGPAMVDVEVGQPSAADAAVFNADNGVVHKATVALDGYTPNDQLH